MTPPIPILLDVDTGADDALALLLALHSPALDIRAITCVAGNHELANVIANTLKLLDAVNAPDIPVAAGMDRPLIETMRPPFHLHGDDGMADLDLPQPKRSTIDLHAVELLHRTIERSDEPLTLIALAPLTNIAVFLRMYPKSATKLKQIVSMGGTLRAIGNTSPTAEFNVRQDPEAASIVLESGLPITLYPLDPFRLIRFHRDEITRFLGADGAGARLAGRVLQHMCDAMKSDSALIGDAGTVATIIDPSGVSMERHPITVELNGTATRGLTIFDQRSHASRVAHNTWWTTSTAEIDVVASVDTSRYRQLFSETLGVDLHNA